MDLFLYVTVFLSAIALVSSRPKEKNEKFAMGTNDMDMEVNRMDDDVISMAGDAVEMDGEANKIEEEANEMDEEVITMKDMDDAAIKTVQREESSRQARVPWGFLAEQLVNVVDSAIGAEAERDENSGDGEFVSEPIEDTGSVKMKEGRSGRWSKLGRWNKLGRWGKLGQLVKLGKLGQLGKLGRLVRIGKFGRLA